MRKMWKNVRQGDIIVCPLDGREEQVTFSRKFGSKQIVRTVKHDHTRPARETVEVKND